MTFEEQFPSIELCKKLEKYFEYCYHAMYLEEFTDMRLAYRILNANERQNEPRFTKFICYAPTVPEMYEKLDDKYFISFCHINGERMHTVYYWDNEKQYKQFLLFEKNLADCVAKLLIRQMEGKSKESA